MTLAEVPILPTIVGAALAAAAGTVGLIKLAVRSRARIHLTTIEVLQGEILRLTTRVQDLERWRDSAEEAHRAELALIRAEKDRIAAEAQANMLRAEVYRLQLEQVRAECDRLRAMLPGAPTPIHP